MEVVSIEPGWPGADSRLRVLLTPDERAFLNTLSMRIDANVVHPTTERTSLDPAVRAELMEKFSRGSEQLPVVE